MSKSYLASILLISFIALAAFGLFMPTMSHAGHSADCPFAPGSMVLCAAPLDHLRHWQDSFLAVLIQSLLFAGIALILTKLRGIVPKRDPQYRRYRLRTRIPIRPPLFQELYSQGVLNRKAP
jgi:hypothetical protein